MQRLHFTIHINAPKEKVWNTLLDEATYRVWTEPFAPGSHYVGNWEKGSKMLFLAPNEQGKMEGMVSRIAENRPNEFMSIEHYGEVMNGKEDTVSDRIKQWAGAHENYTLRDADGGTEVIIDLDSSEDEPEMAEMFKDMWPKALNKLKELAEQ